MKRYPKKPIQDDIDPYKDYWYGLNPWISEGRRDNSEEYEDPPIQLKPEIIKILKAHNIIK